jgi:stage V sporulation protein SpoVS
MKTLRFPRPVLLAAVLLSFPIAALADGGPPPPRFRQQTPAPITNLAPTAQGRLEAAQRSLAEALAALARATGSKGPQLDQAVADATAAQALVADALVWLKSHPEANALPPGPAPAETPAARPATVPAGNQVPGINLLAAIEALNTALGNFLNNPDPAAKTPVLGDLGGHREKIMAAIGRANDSVLALIRSPAVAPAGLATSPAPVPGPMAAGAAQDNVVLPTVPAEAESVAKAYVDMTYSRPNPTLSVPKDTVKIGIILPYYSVTATSQALPTESTGHYFCLIESAGVPIAYLRLVKPDANQPMRVQGGFAVSGPESMPNAVARARAAVKDKPGKYEVRIISYGAQRNAIWLKAIGNGSDYIYTIGGDPQIGLKSASLYSGDDFLSRVLPALKDQASRPQTRGGI